MSEIPAEAYAARYDYERDEVIVTLWTDEQRATEERSEHLLDDRDVEQEAGVSVELEYEDGADAPVENSKTRGGEAYRGCTGGFIGTRGSTYGIITAAHGTKTPVRYDGDKTGSSLKATHRRDLRYTALRGGTPQNVFRYNGSSYRTITSAGAIFTGSRLYKYGRTTGYGSAKIASYKGCVVFTSGKEWCDLYFTDRKVAHRGDSGGPWFVKSTGYGATTGSSPHGSFVTPIASLNSIAGHVRVKTR